MLKYLLITIYILLSHTCIAQQKPVVKDNVIAIKAKKLKQLYLMATKTSNKEYYETLFFQAFPDTFTELNKLYGYYDDKPGPLSNDAENHIINLFNKLTSINDTLYYNKIITIAKDAHWDADGINYFQHGLIDKVSRNIKLTSYIIKKDMTDQEAIGFWAFYFDYENSSMRKKSFEDLLKHIDTADSRIRRLVLTGYQRSTNYWYNSN